MVGLPGVSAGRAEDERWPTLGSGLLPWLLVPRIVGSPLGLLAVAGVHRKAGSGRTFAWTEAAILPLASSPATLAVPSVDVTHFLFLLGSHMSQVATR